VSDANTAYACTHTSILPSRPTHHLGPAMQCSQSCTSAAAELNLALQYSSACATPPLRTSTYSTTLHTDTYLKLRFEQKQKEGQSRASRGTSVGKQGMPLPEDDAMAVAKITGLSVSCVVCMYCVVLCCVVHGTGGGR
jgi:hypothetical protein